MRQLESLRVFLNERLTAAAEEIFGAVEKTVEEYHDENEHLRRLLGITPEITISKIGSMQFSLPVYEEEVSPEQQHCVQEWSPSLRQEDPEPTHVKEEPEELRTSQEEEQLQWIFDNKNSILIPPCVKSECDQEDPCWSLTLPQTQTVGNRDSDSKPEDVQPFDPVTNLKGLDIPCDPPDMHNVSSHSSDLNSDPVGHDVCPSLEPSTTPRKTFSCSDSGETGESFALKSDLKKHLTLSKKRYSECSFCQKHYNSANRLKKHVQQCHGGTSCTCPICGKILKSKGALPRHLTIHTGEKPFRCGDCGKSFRLKGLLKSHKVTHRGEKQFRCEYCGKTFIRKGDLTIHELFHTGEKPFSCADCGKRFSKRQHLDGHERIHTGEKPFSCGDCGKSFGRKASLTRHKQTHIRDKSLICVDCGKSFSKEEHLSRHILTHTRETVQL